MSERPSERPTERAGRLLLAATPLGNAADASARLREAFGTVDVIAAEDTRRVRRLARDLDVVITGEVVSCYEGNEATRVPQLVQRLRAGQDVLLVTDAGTPGVSDPGYRLVQGALAADLPLTVLPGPSAVTAALLASGLPMHRFAFDGFLPRSGAERRRRLRAVATEERTVVVFESPRRLAATLRDLTAACGADRAAAVCRELTKTHEEVVRGTLAELAERFADGALGEVTLVVAGVDPAQLALAPDDPAVLGMVAAAEATGLSTRDAVAQVASSSGVSRRELYAAVQAAHRGRE
jgi:16S rRNA (cytidine1402-2'-O)-methyltransferase